MISNKYKQKFKSAYSLIQNAQNILLVSHINPDEDTISSSCVFSLLLDDMGKSYRVFCKDKISPSFSIIPNSYKVTANLNDFDSFDLIIVSDCGSLNRTGIEDILLSRDKNQKLIEFDHHKKMEDQADLEIRFPNLASTTELLYSFFRFNNLKITNRIADCLLIGLLTDTSNFAHTNTSVETIKVASELTKRGARFNKISNSLDSGKCLNSMHLWGAALSNLKFNKKYKIVFSILTVNDIEKFPAAEKIYDNIVDSLNNIYDANAAILFKEKKDAQINISFRSNSKIDVSRLAAYFGGGGHSKASGAMIRGKIKKQNNEYCFL